MPELTLPQKLRYPEAAHSSRHEISKTMQQAADRIEWLESRLELDPRHSYDGIDCRDETIRQLDKEVARLAAERDQESRLREAAFLDCNDMKHDIERLTATNTELATENEALRAAAPTPPAEPPDEVELVDFLRVARAQFWADAIEEAARVCEEIEARRWDAHKGHGVFNSPSPDEVANPLVQGQSDGASLCAAAIRALARA